jgi:adenylate kinase family enzyme
MSEATMTDKPLSELADAVERQIPHEGALVCVVGCSGSGKTSLVDALMSRGYQTCDPLGEYTKLDRAINDAPWVSDFLKRTLKQHYNRLRPRTLIVDDMPLTTDQLEFLLDLSSAYGDEFVIVHLEADLKTRLRRKSIGRSLTQRLGLSSYLKQEEERTQTLYSQMAKYVPWYIRLTTD